MNAAAKGMQTRIRHVPSFRLRSVASNTVLRNTLLAGIALGLSGCLSGQGGFYGNGSDAPDVAAVKRLMAGIGAIDPETKPIDYKPRAPLAVPPSTAALPDPEADVTEAANLPANWPRDKDAELLALQKSREATGTAALREADRGPGRLSPEEIHSGQSLRSAAAPSAEEQQARLEEMKDNANNRLTPTELRTLKLNKPQSTALFDANGKPVRKYLIEPPVEYSAPAESAPLALPEEKSRILPKWLDKIRRSEPR